MKKHLLFNQSFGTEGSPNQTDETLTRENRIGLMSYLRRTLMLLFAVLMLSIANIATAWGTDFTAAQIADGASSSNISVSTDGLSKNQSKNVCSGTKANSVSVNTSAGATYSSKYIEIQASSGYTISTLSLLARSNAESSCVGAVVFWNGTASATCNSYKTFTAPANNSADCSGTVSITVPAGTRTVRIYRAPQINSSTKAFTSGDAIGGTATFNIFSISATATASVPSTSADTPGAEGEITFESWTSLTREQNYWKNGIKFWPYASLTSISNGSFTTAVPVHGYNENITAGSGWGSYTMSGLTTYAHFAMGISVTSPSVVEVIVDNNQNNDLTLANLFIKKDDVSYGDNYKSTNYTTGTDIKSRATITRVTENTGRYKINIPVSASDLATTSPYIIKLSAATWSAPCAFVFESVTVKPVYTVTYNANGKDGGGAAPTDGSSPYVSGSNVTVLGNTNSMTKTDCVFNGWNTRSDGTGTHYDVGDEIASISENITLYAEWVHFAESIDIEHFICEESPDASKKGAFLSTNYYNATVFTNTGYECNTSSGKEGFKGLKMKDSGFTLTFYVPADQKVTFGFGRISSNSTNPNFTIKKNGTTQSLPDLTLDSDASYKQEVICTTSEISKFELKTTNGSTTTLMYISIDDPCTDPGAATGLGRTSATGTSLTLGWTAGSNASSYKVSLFTDADCTVEASSTEGNDYAVNTNSVTFTGLSLNSTYYFKVQSIGDGSTYCEEGPWSSASGAVKTGVCNDYSFHYGTENADDWTTTCFTQVGATSEWEVTDFTIPSKPNWYVGKYGFFYNDGMNYENAKSHTDAWSDLFFAASQGNGSGTRPKVGAATGATGRIRIYNNSSWNNLFASFEPDGYKLKFGSSTYDTFEADGSVDHCYWSSSLYTYSSSNAGDLVSVGIIDANNDFVSTNNTEGMKHIFLNTGGTDYWSKDNITNFGLWNETGKSWTCLMTKVPGEDYLYEGWVPSTCTQVIFARLKSGDLKWKNNDSDGSNTNVYDQTGTWTIPANTNMFTISSWSSGSWSAYTKSGKFRMWDNSTDKNWYVHFYPHNVLSYDGNGGSGSMTPQSVKADAADQELTVVGNGFTRTGWTFTGWNTEKHGKGTAYAAGDDIDVTEDITLYAQWKKTVYFKVGAGWDGSSAWYAIYCFDSENDSDPYRDWVRMNTAASSCETDVFKGDLPGNGYDKLIVCRMDGSKDALAWDSKWNQTGNISYDELDDNDQFTPTSLSGDECTGSWGTYSAPTWTISFAGNDNTGGSMSNISSIACDANQAITVNAFTKTGYNFAGWKANVDVKVNDETVTAGSIIANSATIQNVRSNITLTAQWSQIMVSSITLDPTSKTLTIDETQTITPTVLPATALDKTITWTTSDDAVATVDDGVVTAVGAGTATITATANDGSGVYAECAITVEEAASCSGNPTALAANTVYQAADMLSNCANPISSMGQQKYGLSTNGKFYIVGTTDDNNASTGTVEIKTENNTDIGGDSDADFTSVAYLKMAGSQDHHSIKFVVPTAGILTVWGYTKGGNYGDLQIKPQDGDAVTLITHSESNIKDAASTSVTAGTYYILSNGNGAAIYGLRFEEITVPDVSGLGVDDGATLSSIPLSWKIPGICDLKNYKEPIHIPISGSETDYGTLNEASYTADGDYVTASGMSPKWGQYGIGFDIPATTLFSWLSFEWKGSHSNISLCGTTCSNSQAYWNATEISLNDNSKWTATGQLTPNRTWWDYDYPSPAPEVSQVVIFANSADADYDDVEFSVRNVRYGVSGQNDIDHVVLMRKEGSAATGPADASATKLYEGTKSHYTDASDVTGKNYYYTVFAVHASGAVSTGVSTSLTLYTITYSAGANGTGTVAAGKKTHGIDFTLSSSTFTRDGYTQDGWSTSDGGDKIYELGATYSTDAALTLYPHWVAVSGPVITNGNPANGSIAVTDGSTPILSAVTGSTVYIAATPSTGYNFTGWDVYKTDDASTKVSTAAATASTTFEMPSYAVTVNASFAAKTYTVTLNGNGGSGNTANVTATYNSSTLSSSITNPTLTGYIFDGWYSGEGGTGTLIINSSGVLQSSTTYSDGSGNWANDGAVTLYAKWTRDVKTAGWGAPWGGTAIPNATTSTVNSVTLNACNSAKGTLWSQESYTMGNGDSVTINLASGYYISAVSTAALFDEYGGNTNKLYIQFNSQSTYTNSKYDLDEPITLGDDCYKAWEDISTAPLASVSPISAGAQSAKIYCSGNSASGNYLYRIVVEIKAWDCTPSSTITFAAGAGTGTAPQARKYCGTLTLPDEGGLSKEGYNFAGWNDGVATYFTGETYEVTEDVTFTAQWRDMETPLIIPTVTHLDATNYHYAPAFTKYDVDGSGVIKCINIEGQDSVDWKFKITPGYYSISIAYGAPSGLSTDVTAKIYEVGDVSDKFDRLVMSESFTTGSSDARTRLCSKIFKLNLDEDKTYRIVVKDTYSDDSSHPCVGYINFTPLSSPMTIADDESLTYSNVVASPGTVVFDVKDDGNDVTCLNLEDQNMAEWFAYITPNTYTIKMLYGTAAWSTNLTFSIIDPTDGTSVYAPSAVTKSNGETHWDEEYTWSDVDLTGVSDSKPYIIRVKDTYSSKGSRPKIAHIDFIPTKYELAWSSNGGNALTGDYTSGDVAAGVAITAPDDPTRTGYDFVKWNSEDDGTGDDLGAKMPMKDVTYYAQWEIIDYTIAHSDATNGSYTIKVGDASAVSTNTTGNYNQTVALVATPSSGYVIDGWNVSGATVGNNNIASTTFTMPAGNVTVAPTFKLMPNVYYYQDGTRYASSTYKAPDGSVASSGDNNAINSGNEWTVSNSISGLTVSAKGCTYDGKSGSEIHITSYLKVPKGGNASNQYVKFVVAAGYKATSLKMKIGGYSSNPTVTLKPYTTELGDAISYTGTVGGVATTENNFKEISWSNLAAGTYYLNVSGQNAYISEITAQTEQVGYTVSFAVDGGSTGYGTVSPSSITEVTHGSTVSISGNVLTLKETAVTATPTAESDEYTYAFDSWSVSDGASITSAQTITASFTRTAKEYTLTWDLNGGKVSTAGTAAAVDETEPSGSVAYNTALTAPVVTKSGYDFAGWSPSVDDNMPAANTTYTATWAERFTVTYNAMTGSVDPTSATGSTANKVSLPEPTKDGYDFDGWYNTAGEKIGDAGDKYGPTAAITLYAKWKGSCAGSDKSVRFTTSDKNDAGSYYDNLSSGNTQLVGNGKAKMIATGDCKIYAKANQDGYRADRCAIVFKFTKTTALDIYYCAGSSSRSFALYSFSSDKALADIVVSDYETKSAVTSVTGVKAAFANTTATSSNPSISSGVVATSGSSGGIKATYSSLSAGYYVLLPDNGEGYFYGFDIDGGANPCYQVTYHGNNATSGYVNDPEQYAADADPYVKYNTNGYERTGYEFVGWNTAANGSGTPYAEGAQITDIAADVNLYAQWRILIEGTNEDFAGYTSVTSADDIRLAEGATLTIKSTRTIHDIILETGSTLNVNTTNGDGTGDGVTLTVNSLSLKGGLNSSCTAYDMPRVYINSKSSLEKSESTVNFDISVDQRNYYPIAVPFPVEVAEVDYVNSTMATYSIYGKHFVIKEYDGASRAENGAIDDNWVVVSNTAGTKLLPGKGYILTAISKPAYGGGVIRFPMSFTDAWTTKGEQATVSAVTKNTVAVEAYEGTATEGGKNSNKGWNMLGVPYMSCFDASDASTSPSDAFIKGRLNFITGEYTDAENVYVSVPTSDFSEYIQKPVSEAVLLPGWCFFVQVSENATVSFAAAGQEDDSSLPIYAPKREQAMPTVKTGIILSSETASDKTTILVSDKYSVTDYEINADLEKMFGNGYTLATYSLAGTTRLAYNAMSNSDATNVIPIGYRAPADGEYTFAINPRYAENGAFEHVNLIDYETGFVTDLLVSSYSFATERTQNDERFALNVVKAPQTATDITVTGDGLQVTGPQKVIINDKLYIIVDGRMYDAKGVMVK